MDGAVLDGNSVDGDIGEGWSELKLSLLCELENVMLCMTSDVLLDVTLDVVQLTNDRLGEDVLLSTGAAVG